MYLYGFTFALSLSLFVGRGACPSRCINPCHSRNHCKRTIIPLLRTITLASLVKGRWIDGKAQTVSLLRFTCDISVFFYLPNFSAVKTEGLLSYPTINEIFRTIPLAFRRVRVCVCFICSASLRNFGHTR